VVAKGMPLSRYSDVPVKVHLPGPAVQVYAGGSTVDNRQGLALLANRTVWAWGNDSCGAGEGRNVTEAPTTSHPASCRRTWSR